jgi:hypothetical protein
VNHPQTAAHLHRNIWGVRAKRPLINEGTALGKVPRDWLDYIEPKITRHGFDGCWIWIGKTTKEGIPVMHWKHVDEGWKHTTAAKFVMEIFWEYPIGFFIRRVCPYDQCLNPNHLYISPTTRD